MSLKVSDNLLMTLDESSREAYVLAGVISAQHEGVFLHSDSLYRYITRKFPDLQIDFDTTRDTLHSLAEKGVLIRKAYGVDDPTYHLNPDYLKTK